MYQVSIFKNNVETIVHYPSANKEAPHVLSLNMKESLSQAEELSFSMPYGNPGYSLIEGLITKVKVYDTRDSSVVFSGRVIPIKDGMNADGKFTNQVTCEGAMNYLVDTQTRRWNFTNKTPSEILQYLLNQHNSKVDSSRRIQLGTIQVTQPITIDTNYETTLNTIITKLRNVLGGDIRVQERNGVLYLDYLLAQGANNGVKIELRKNLKEIIREYDPTDIVTRVIPLGYGEGINQLDITKVNSNIEYIEDSIAIAKYGIIEGVATNKDLQNADTLKIYGQTILNEKKQPSLSYSITALDLSVLTGYENEKYNLGDTLETIVDIMNIDVFARVIERYRDMLNNPWNPKLTISTRPITLTDQIISLKQRNLTLENAPQGNTCIFPLMKAENTDSYHPIEFDLDIPQEAININRVYLNIHGRKYRVDSKDSKAGGSYQRASEVQAKSTTVNAWQSLDDPNYSITPPTGIGQQYVLVNTVNGFQVVDFYAFGHIHNFNVTIPAINIDDHTHEQVLGIVEGTFPKNVKIKVNNNDIGVNLGNGNSGFDQYNIDITPYVHIGNNKIQITTEQNGRIDAVVYSQIFIQSK